MMTASRLTTRRLGRRSCPVAKIQEVRTEVGKQLGRGKVRLLSMLDSSAAKVTKAKTVVETSLSEVTTASEGAWASARPVVEEVGSVPPPRR